MPNVALLWVGVHGCVNVCVYGRVCYVSSKLFPRASECVRVCGGSAPTFVVSQCSPMEGCVMCVFLLPRLFAAAARLVELSGFL